MTDNPSEIPNEIKRETRKRCAFGCIICGLPVFDYDHIVPYSKTREHSANNITLLCQNHHRDKTNGRISMEFIIQKNKNPFNSSRSKTAGHRLHIGGARLKAIIGSDRYVQDMDQIGSRFDAITLEGIPLIYFEFEEGSILIGATLYDKDRNVSLIIEKGEIQASTGSWDFESSGTSFIIRSAPRNIDVVVDIQEDTISITRCYLYSRNLAIKIDESDMIVVGPNFEMSVGGNYLENNGSGFSFG